jgi:TQXA domain-containing protein
MKVKNFIKGLGCFIISVLIISNIIGVSAAETVKVTIDKTPLYVVQYNGNDITARRIRIQGSNNVAYCLEINKSYPSGQNFAPGGSITELISNVIAAGYPNRSVTQLNLENEDEAYFATQIAVWSAAEGYDVNKMTGANSKILQAIKTIYNDGVIGKYNNVIQSKVYTTSVDSIQEIIVVQFEDLLSEEKAESKQAEYPPQEG